MTNKAVAYVRYSSDMQSQESIDAQLRAIQEYCSKNSFELLNVYQDAAQSATNDQRDQFLQMIDDSKLRKFDYIIVHKLDRFARNRYDSAFYKRELRMNGVRLLSVLEKLDDSPESVILESVLEGMAEYFSINLAREVRKGLNENALKAKHNGGVPPLGYSVTDGLYVINEKEAEIVQMIFTAYAAGNGYMAIADKLNALGYKSRFGNPFGKNSLYDILRNEKYLGTYTYNKRLSKKTGNRVFKEESKIVKIEDAIPQIISNQLWEDAHAMINSKSFIKKNSAHMYLLTGKVKCGVCGGSYVGGGYMKDKKYGIYRYICSQRKRSGGCTGKAMNAEVIENFVIEHIRNHILTDSYIDEMAQNISVLLNDESKNDDSQLTQINKQIEQCDKRDKKLWTLMYDDLIDKKQFSEELKKVTSERESLLLMLRNVQFKAENMKFDKSAILRFMRDLKDNKMVDNYLSRKTLIDAFLNEIVFFPDYVEIYIKKIPSPLKVMVSDSDGGDNGTRTHYPNAASVVLYQMSYIPTKQRNGRDDVI